MTLTPLFVALGGALGAVCRHLVDTHIERARVDTLVVNVLGSLLLGFVLAAPLGESAVALAGTGFCGAFTTFSSFAFETVRLAETGDPRRALGNAAVNLAGAVAAVLVGGAVVGALL